MTGGGWIEPPEGAFKDPSSIDPPEILVNQVIDFEDLYPGYETPDIPLPAGYAGFDWSPYSYAITKYYHAGSGYEYGTIGMVSLYTAWAADISFGGKPFDFKGAYITAAWDATENVIVEGWADGSLLYQTTITTHNDDAYWFDFEFEGVDHVWFRPQGAHIAIDDITVSFVRPTTVDDCVLPEVTCPTGKTNFGFNAKYKKNATEPTGQLEFQFRAGELNFHSSGYDWLVITPDDLAILRGSGTINGQGEYQFRLWARDGEPDTFRMRIWEVDEFGNRTPIFDNGYAQPTGGGNITVHH
ncbi:MAG: hypothetical protein GTO22_27435 [Gemmatimonadales bacterium]|nr:hypothetical protein [Gemmatimonadales bacterium]